MKFFVAILSLLIAVAGWHYLFYSRSAPGLASLELPSSNRRRIRLRRAGGCAMMALAVCFFAGFFTVDFGQQPHAFVAIWLTVFVLLAVILVLGLIDMRLTMKLRQDQKREK